VGLFVMLFIVYWCYGTQLSVNGAAAADFWGTKNAGINYGMLFTAWGVAGLLGGRIGGCCSTSTTITRWRSTPRRVWRQWRCVRTISQASGVAGGSFGGQESAKRSLVCAKAFAHSIYTRARCLSNGRRA
jgi:hypothetical protein